MLVRRAEDLMFKMNNLLSVFGIDKNIPTEHKKLFGEFRQLFPTYDSYMEFLEQYRGLIHNTVVDNKKVLGVEGLIKQFKHDMQNYYYHPDAQSYAALLANIVTKLYFLRTAARSWRREINIELNKKEVA